MRHRNTVKKLNRPTDERISLIRNLLKSIVKNEKITTTEARSKVVRSHFDKLINLAKKSDMDSFRKAFAILRDTELTRKLTDDIAKRYDHKNSGYLHTYKLENRKGDNARMVRIELTK